MLIYINVVSAVDIIVSSINAKYGAAVAQAV
jgi:hypothetical protein